MVSSKAAIGWGTGWGKEEPGQLILCGVALICLSSLPLTARPASHPVPSKVLFILLSYEAFVHGPCTSFFLSGTLFPVSLVSLPLFSPAYSSGFTLDASSSRKSSPLPPPIHLDVSLCTSGVNLFLLALSPGHSCWLIHLPSLQEGRTQAYLAPHWVPHA